MDADQPPAGGKRAGEPGHPIAERGRSGAASRPKIAQFAGAKTSSGRVGSRSPDRISSFHGGPGSSLTPFIPIISRAWERHFTVVHWDQRGAGLTYSRAPKGQGRLSLGRIAEDGLEVTSHALERTGQAKAILLGALGLRDRRHAGEIAEPDFLVELEQRLRAQLARPVSGADSPQGRLLRHLEREFDALFTFLCLPGVPVTNWMAEQALRPAVVNRKV